MPSELQLKKLKCVQMHQYNVGRFLWNSISSYWFVFLSDQTGFLSCQNWPLAWQMTCLWAKIICRLDIYSTLSLQCITGQFSTVTIFGCFWSGRDFVAVFWSIFLGIKAKQDQSGSCFLFNLLCEWFFDRLLEKIEITGQTGWEWKLHV